MDKLITRLRVRFPELSEDDILLSIEVMLDAMASRLSCGERIELRGFGSFKLNTERQEPPDRPLLNADASAFENSIVRFKPGRDIRENINM